MQPVNLTFDYSEKEYAAAARYFHDQTTRFRPTRVLLVMGIVAVIWRGFVLACI